ncbi:MAG: hypothetical protein KDC98_10820, partial [Planctomycetes bacterium]|nr:hypothetical protein [Planctomycetota bacterium]
MTVTPNGHVFAGGNFAGHFAEWDGAAWSYHSVVSGGGATISTLVSLPNGDVIAGGNFWVQGSTWSNVGRWDGQL